MNARPKLTKNPESPVTPSPLVSGTLNAMDPVAETTERDQAGNESGEQLTEQSISQKPSKGHSFNQLSIEPKKLPSTTSNANTSWTDILRRQVEMTAGYNLSGVGIMQDSQIAERANVEALTIGQNIHLAPGKYAPSTSHGAHVLRHEFAHVVQQATGETTDIEEKGKYQALEKRANEVASLSYNTSKKILLPLPTISETAAQAFDEGYHEDETVKGAVDAGFSADEAGDIYAANWERDLSQGHPAFANAILAWKGAKMAARRREPIEPHKANLSGAIAVIGSIAATNPKELYQAKTYGGYRYYEHMDNPGAEDSVKSDKSLRSKLLVVPEGASLPQYLLDSREYMKAELYKSAQAYRGDLDKGSAKGVADAFEERKKEINIKMYQGQKVDNRAASSENAAASAKEHAETYSTNKDGNGGATERNATSNGESKGSPSGKWSAEAADGLGRATHALQDFFSHSNFLELAIEQPMPTLAAKVNAREGYSDPKGGARGAADAPSNGAGGASGYSSEANTKLTNELGTGTFGTVAALHTLSHKVQSFANAVGKGIVFHFPSSPDNGGAGGAGGGTPISGGNSGEATSGQPDSRGGAGGASGEQSDSREGARGAGGGQVNSPGQPRRIRQPESQGGARGAGGGPPIQGTIYLPGSDILSRVGERLEDVSRGLDEPGSHTQIAKDQPAHGDDMFSKLKTIKFELAHQLASVATSMILGKMRGVFDAVSSDQANSLLVDIYATLDALIARPEGHPLEHIIEQRREEAKGILQKCQNDRSK